MKEKSLTVCDFVSKHCLLLTFDPAEAALHSLLRALTNETYSDATQHLEREQALAKQFAEILHFTLRFDELKVLNTSNTLHTQTDEM